MSERGGQDDDGDRRLLFWYWVPVVGAGIGLMFMLLAWWIGP